MPDQFIVNAALATKNNPTGHSLRTMVIAVCHRLSLAWQIRGERRKLAGLSDQALHDIGITPTEANAESSRRFFDMPANRQ